MSYFKPLRRKFGVVTLGLACLAMAAWLRSMAICDVLIASSPTSQAGQLRFSSCRSKIMLFSYQRQLDHPTVRLASRQISSGKVGDRFPFSGFDGGLYWEMAGFGLGNAEQPKHGHVYGFDVLMIPYWSIVLMPTLISAWLLLSKPREPTPRPLS